jgi:hypothetical protein
MSRNGTQSLLILAWGAEEFMGKVWYQKLPLTAGQRTGKRHIGWTLIVTAKLRPQVQPQLAQLSSDRFRRGFDEIVPVDVVKEDVVALIAAAHHLIDGPRKLHSHFSGHDTNSSEAK